MAKKVYRCKNSGYTLIEVLIALSVFAILAVITSMAMYNAYSTRGRVNEQAEQLSALQLMMTIIERDTKQIIDRPIRGDNMQQLPSLIGDNQYIEFTRDGLVNPNGLEKRSSLKRIAYLCKDNQLFRRSWAVLDDPKRGQFQDKLLLNNLIGCSFAFLDHNRQVLSLWRASLRQQNQAQSPLPIAIQINLKIKHWGEIKRTFIIPEALYG